MAHRMSDAAPLPYGASKRKTTPSGRDPSANIDDVLWEAHTAVLNMNVQLTPADATFFLPGGHGEFLARIARTRNRSDGLRLHIQCRTWLHQDAMHQTRVPVATTDTFGARIGDNLLMPVPLRHLAQLPDPSVAEDFFAKSRELSDLHRDLRAAATARTPSGALNSLHFH
jgi:hypothetical protein